MLNTVLWDQWNSVHSDSEQIKRQNRACEKKITPIHVDKNDCAAVFKGSSGNYSTTLTDCTCRDFVLKKLPCKHMYRLAYELHLFALPKEVIEDEQLQLTGTSSQLSKDEAMELIQKVLTPDEQKQFGYFCYHCGNNNSSEDLFSAEFSYKLLSANLACEVTDTSKLLKYLHISKIREMLPPGLKSPRKKTELISLVAPLIKESDIVFPDNQKCLTLHPSISHLGHTIHRQICILYPDAVRDYF